MCREINASVPLNKGAAALTDVTNVLQLAERYHHYRHNEAGCRVTCMRRMWRVQGLAWLIAGTLTVSPRQVLACSCAHACLPATPRTCQRREAGDDALQRQHAGELQHHRVCSGAPACGYGGGRARA